MSRKNKLDLITEQAIKEFEAAVDFKKPRVQKWQEIEDLYFMKSQKILKGRINIPVPIMSSFVNTLHSKIDDAPVIEFEATEEADIPKSRKVNAAWRFDSSSVRGQWDMKDRGIKKLALMSGRGIFKYFAEGDPYNSNLEWVDHYDFLVDPTGGSFLETHDFCGQDGIYRTKWQLQQGVKDGLYDASQVNKLVNRSGSEEQQADDDRFQEKKNRYQALGLNTQQLKFVYPGQEKYKMIEWCTTFKGKRYYLLFNYESKLWVRVEPLKNVFKSDLYPWASWAVYEDLPIFWSMAPAEEMVPVSYAIQMLINQAFENRQKINWGQKAYDPAVFTEPAMLKYRPDGLVPAKASELGTSIGNAVYEFRTPEVQGTIDLVAFFDSYTGQKTGVTPSVQGVSERDKKVGIFFGELQQVADRLGLLNKYYSAAWKQLGTLYLNGLREHMGEKMAVRMIGEKGLEWDDLIRKDLKTSKDGTDFDITVRAGSADLSISSQETRARLDAIKSVADLGTLSPRWVTRKILLAAGFEDEDIKQGMDIENEGDREIIAEAARENQQIALGEDVKPNRGATSGHLQKHLDFFMDKELEPEAMKKLVEHFQAEAPIAAENMNRKAKQLLTTRLIQGQGGGAPSAPTIDDHNSPQQPAAAAVPSLPGQNEPDQQAQNTSV